MNSNSARCLLAWLFAVVLLFRGGNALRESFAARNWPSVNAVVSESDARWVEHHRSVRMSMWTYELHLRYLYMINGKEYVGARYSFSAWGPNENFNPFDSRISRGLLGGSKVLVRYDPLDPSQSVLQPTPRLSAWVAFVLGLFLARVGVIYSRRVQAGKIRVKTAASAASLGKE